MPPLFLWLTHQKADHYIESLFIYFFKSNSSKNQDRSSTVLPKGFIFTWAIARIIATSRREAMGLYEQEGAVAAIARSRTALATGKMRLALAGAETLGGCGGGGVGMEVMVVGGFLYILLLRRSDSYMIYPGLSMCFVPSRAMFRNHNEKNSSSSTPCSDPPATALPCAAIPGPATSGSC